MSGREHFAGDLRTLLQLLRGRPRNGSQADRLQAFYAPQAAHYDAFRARLLHGREELLARLRIEPGMRVVELGCGTGSNLAVLGAGVATLARFDLVDLCPALLALARERAKTYPNVVVHEADAATWQPQGKVDRVVISYALTMIPDWQRVIDNAHSMLAPGGQIGVVDFHLPEAGLLNGFWRRWFAHDGVHLSDKHLRALRTDFPNTHWWSERRAPLPYFPLLKAPYYLFVGYR